LGRNKPFVIFSADQSLAEHVTSSAFQPQAGVCAANIDRQ
jgi:hypothetical protein